MSQTIEESTREQVAVFLPLAIKRAAESYHDFMEAQKEPEVSKKFGEHHKACRVAIAHLELLLKLARWVDLPEGEAEKIRDDLNEMLSQSIKNHEEFEDQAAGEEDLA